jgi:transglutaminase-like putative cysteine protease
MNGRSTYRVRHQTEYLYADAVSTSHHEVHLYPRIAPGQTVRDKRLDVLPEPGLRRDHIDWFGNPATHLAIHTRHTRLAVTSSFVVDIARQPPPEDDGPWEAARDWVLAGADAEARAAVEMALPSPRIGPSSAARAFAEPSFAPGRPLVEVAHDLMHRIHDEFAYDPAATDVSTPLDEVLSGRRGVCQDFAHVQLACLRAFGLAARYVSGYLVTRPGVVPDGESDLVGADASHAWVSVRLPGGSWLDLDPTNDVVPSDRHIVVAVGRDFGDVTPMRGVLLGGGRHQLIVGVDVTPIESQSQSQGQSQGG